MSKLRVHAERVVTQAVGVFFITWFIAFIDRFCRGAGKTVQVAL